MDGERHHVGRHAAGGERVESIVIVVQGQADLLEVVLTFNPVGCLSNALHSGKEKSHQDGDKSDHYEQFDERKAMTIPTHELPPVLEMFASVMPGLVTLAYQQAAHVFPARRAAGLAPAVRGWEG